MPSFSTNCKRCPRLANYLKQVRQIYPNYHARPVPAFGEDNARLCIVGLAPGLHGANASGRPFTGDHAGILLYATLYKYGFASKEKSSAHDDLKLINCRITNAVKCLPPQNRPLASEIDTCNRWLQQEFKSLPENFVIIALGAIAHKAVLKALALKQKDYVFAHGAEHQLNDGILLDSYHCSRYNTQTGRLTVAMFEAIFVRAHELVRQED